MRLQIIISNEAPEELFRVFASNEFAGKFLARVVAKVFKVTNYHKRPGEHFVHQPEKCSTDHPDWWGINLILHDVKESFLTSLKIRALEVLRDLAVEQVEKVRRQILPSVRIQVCTVLQLQGVVETVPGSDRYSNNLAVVDPVWITNNGVCTDPPPEAPRVYTASADEGFLSGEDFV